MNLALFVGSVALGWFGDYLFRSRQAVVVAASSRFVNEDAGADLASIHRRAWVMVAGTAWRDARMPLGAGRLGHVFERHPPA